MVRKRRIFSDPDGIDDLSEHQHVDLYNSLSFLLDNLGAMDKEESGIFEIGGIQQQKGVYFLPSQKVRVALQISFYPRGGVYAHVLTVEGKNERRCTLPIRLSPL